MRPAIRPVLLAAGIAVGAGSVRAADEIGPGAYCPLPKKGEEPKCLAPARDAYQDFFTALSEGSPDDARLADVEDDVARGADAAHPYLALSSLSYAYWRLSERAVRSPEIDPRLAGRLERWNQLLSQAYAASGDDPRYRDAVRSAAVELHERVRVPLPCSADAEEQCQSTESVLRAMHDTSDQVGLRGAIRQLLRRWLGTAP